MTKVEDQLTDLNHCKRLLVIVKEFLINFSQIVLYMSYFRECYWKKYLDQRVKIKLLLCSK